MRARRGALEEAAARLPKRHLKAQDGGFHAAHARALRIRADPTGDPALLAARALLEKEADGRTRFRLLGVSTADFVAADSADQGDLVDKDIGRERARERAIDQLREKFGAGAVVRGLAFRTGAAKPRP